jgi:hypothetical protein
MRLSLIQVRTDTAGLTRAATLPCAVLGCAALLAAACAAGPPLHAAPRSSPAVASGPAPARQVLAARYTAIASAGNRRLDTDFDQLDGPDDQDLTADRAALRDIVVTERTFDRRLAGIAFPPGIEKAARSLVAVNQSRTALTAEAAGLSSISQLRAFRPLLAAANGPVEVAVRVIRSKLGLPPPETS